MVLTAINDNDDEYFNSAAYAREQSFIQSEEELQPSIFPELGSISPRVFYQFLPIPNQSPDIPEYVYVNRPNHKNDGAHLRFTGFVSSWNMTWEAGRQNRGIHHEDIPDNLQWLLDIDADLRLVHKADNHSYDAYAPLYHLLPRKTLEAFGLPFLRRGLWPLLANRHLLDNILPNDFDSRLERALMFHLWPKLNSRGIPSQYSDKDPIKILSHNLDYWMPYIDLVLQQRMQGFGRTVMEDAKQRKVYRKYKNTMPEGVTLKTPLKGGTFWVGEEEAEELTQELINMADQKGDLRAILDAVRSSRIEDDFSERWSYEREDFERKLYAKRNKVKVSFVELDDTIPVHGPLAEVHEKLLWQDFIGLLDKKEKRVVVCLRSGVTKIGEIARTLGYANHSPISKRLSQIQRKAKRFFELS